MTRKYRHSIKQPWLHVEPDRRDRKSRKFVNRRFLADLGASPISRWESSPAWPHFVPSIAVIVSRFTGWMMPFSVMMPEINSAGVTSKAGL